MQCTNAPMRQRANAPTHQCTNAPTRQYANAPMYRCIKTLNFINASTHERIKTPNASTREHHYT
eukprot:11228232-Lingulodinium_polyedra.AAC.1